jgi:hypothetical protein
MQPPEPSHPHEPKKPNPIFIILPFGSAIWFAIMAFTELSKRNPNPITVGGSTIAFIGFLVQAVIILSRSSR